MGRNLDSKCKICRRAGRKLFLKGERCYSPKCSLGRRKYPPGVHGVKGYPKLSEYGEILREKQNMKNFYGLLEKQFKNYFKKAKKEKGDQGTIFLRFLEKRLDNVLYRAGFFISRNKARQVINHGLATVNGKVVDIPSYEVKIGDLIKLKTKESLLKAVKEAISKRYSESLPLWFNVDKEKIEIKILKMPNEEDLLKEFNVRAVVEFYSRQ